MPYLELAALFDVISEECDDNVRCITRKLDALSEDARKELVISDLLNAYQVFYFMFRTEPDDLVRERLELEPASALCCGLKIDQIDLLEMFFAIHENKAVIVISDGDTTLATFSGKSAYDQGRTFLENPEYR